MSSEPELPAARALKGAFGEKNRRRLIEEYFREKGTPTAAQAWKYVYGMLLWVDSSIGLAHCYESDKCQPGKPWYARSLAFHRWLASELGSAPADAGKQIDWFFQKVIEPYLANRALEQQAKREKGAQQRAAYPGEVLPLPGSDPEIERIVAEKLKAYLAAPPPPEVYDALAAGLREYWQQENKRKNLLGEGFEDVLAAIINAVCGDAEVSARTRLSIADVAGFHRLGDKDKPTKVDLVIESPRWARPSLANVKWSFRSDREDQLWDDFKEYVRFDRHGRGFDHYLVTNEFDPARLNAVCDRRESNNFVFRSVVHVNLAGVLAAYGPAEGFQPGKPPREASMGKVRQQAKDGRLIGLSAWLEGLKADG